MRQAAKSVLRVAPVAMAQPPAVRPIAQYSALRPHLACAVPLAFTAALLALTVAPSISQNPRLTWSFFGAGLVLTAWTALLFARLQASHGTRAIEVVLR